MKLAERTGVASKAIRYYETIGRSHDARRSTNSYRDYAERDVERMVFICRCREWHAPPDELKVWFFGL